MTKISSLLKKSTSKCSLDSLNSSQSEMRDMSRRSSNSTAVNPSLSSNPLGLTTLQKGVSKSALSNAEKANTRRFPIKYEAARHAGRFFEFVSLVILLAVCGKQDTPTVNSMGAYGAVSLANVVAALGLVFVIVFVCCHFLHFFGRFKKTLTSRKLLVTEGISNLLAFVLFVAAMGLSISKSVSSGNCGVAVSLGCDLYNWVIVFLALNSAFFLGSTIIDACSYYYGIKSNEMNDVELAMTLRRISRSG